jgi:uncharacterized membrane protein
MPDLLVIEFPSEEKAAGVRETLLAMRDAYLIEPGDVVVAVKEADDRLKLNQLLPPVEAGAIGLFWGSVMGMLKWAAPSAVTGARLPDLGLDDEFMRRAGRTLESGNAALFLLMCKP